MAYNVCMNTTRVRIDPDDPGSLPEGRVDYEALDRTSEADLIAQQREDDAEAMRDMARFARRVRRRMGLTQVEFARRIDVSHETIRNWEQGKRGPTGAARTLLRILDKAPEIALRVLNRDVAALVIVLLGMSLAACQHDTRTHAGVSVQVEDSAGVRIVKYAGTPVVSASFRFPAQPRYRHGANPGDYTFQGIHPGTILPDGSAVVSDVFNGELVVVSPDGATHEVLAGPGEGPGEVGYVGAVYALGQDRVLAADRDLGRVTVFAGGSVERTVDIRSAYGLGVLGISSSGQLLMATSSFRSGFEEPWLPGHMARFDMETSALDTVASYDFASRPPPGLRWDPISAFGRVAGVAGEFVYTRSDKPEVTWRSPDGTVTQIVRWQAEAAPLTEELLAGIEAGLRAGNRMANPGAADAAIDRMTDENMAVYRARIGGPMPLFAIPLGDREGRVWLPSWRPGAAREGASHYTVISADGEWLGTVEGPPGLRILDVAHGLVLGVQRDEMDVESVVLYEMVRE